MIRRRFLPLVLVSFAMLWMGCPREKTQQTDKREVAPGDPDLAIPYYTAIFQELGLDGGLSGQALIDAQNLPIALSFLGYSDVPPKDFENTVSADLNRRFPDAVLSAMYFAPKIVDVSVSPLNIGWRKVLRIKPRSGSSAEKLGVEAAYLLFNKFQGPGDVTTDPMTNESKNTQLIFTRGPTSTLPRAVYFLVYGPISEGDGKLKTYLEASFDVRAPNIEEKTVNKYYVPNACSECHGGSKDPDDDPTSEDWQHIKINYLDTDHWFDRLDDDFAVLKTAPYGVLYDGGKDTTTTQFETAFDVVRRLNSEIRTQNQRVEVDPAIPSFQLRAVTKWVDLHKTDSTHKNYFDRVLPSTSGPVWSATSDPDKELLPLMNRYCYRCHSSLKYNVFDRPAVVRLTKNPASKPKIPDYLTRPETDPLRMPQDRVLDPPALDNLITLFSRLK